MPFFASLLDRLLARVQPRGGEARRATLRTATSTAGSAAPTLLDPGTLARIGKLDLVARTVVDGVMSGIHRSTHRGGCCEFAEHRPYTPGDEPRMLDWRLYARSDRYFVKQYEDETNLQAWMVIDASPSMQFGLSTVTKFDYARMACACLARMLLRQRDSIGMLLEEQRMRHLIPPRPQANHFLSLCDTLARATPTGQTTIASQLSSLTPHLKRRGLVVVFSDYFEDIPALADAVGQLRVRGHDVILFQILAPEEITFSFRHTAIFEDLEHPANRLHVTPATVRQRYRERFAKFMAELQHATTRHDCELTTLTTDRDLGELLAYYLHRRAALQKKRPAPATA